ncbi:hypothetical protein HBH56_028890 [Parastagonospora nodorum]|nr:hypothetical protein HBH56_028890 [Parastagonospora nodorum]KAH3934352.1 hypothetical protein HBH54_053150 [Parastagonospora nodorum]KAH4141878.1 hypothetical protein HBH45_063640 [Parastagonospora nodorum]KAH4150981.1 hypothetical protein HBH44_171940 [Parastagonospora nodorum]KAH4580237.1 hypothetical protein HBH84_046830 [Parastagonospora nodorum]
MPILFEHHSNNHRLLSIFHKLHYYLSNLFSITLNMKLSIVFAVAFATLGFSAPDNLKIKDKAGVVVRTLAEVSPDLAARQAHCPSSEGSGCRVISMSGHCCCTDCTPRACNEMCSEPW